MISNPPASQAKVVDYTGKICKSAESYGYFYKTQLPLTVDKNFEDCYFWMNTDYAERLAQYPDFTMKNAYYLSNRVIKEWCLDPYVNEDGETVSRDDFELIGPSFMDYKLPVFEWRTLYEMDGPGWNNCFTFNENPQQARLTKTLADNPCLAYYDAPVNNICAMCKAGSARIFIYIPQEDGTETKGVICGSVRTPNRD